MAPTAILASQHLESFQGILEELVIIDEKTELNNAKQAVNELTNSDRIKEIANKAGLSINNDSIKSVR